MCIIFKLGVPSIQLLNLYNTAPGREVVTETSQSTNQTKKMYLDVCKLKLYFLTEFKDNEALLPDLLLTIASLSVRSEFCAVVEEAGGLKFMINAMVSSFS